MKEISNNQYTYLKNSKFYKIKQKINNLNLNKQKLQQLRKLQRIKHQSYFLVLRVGKTTLARKIQEFIFESQPEKQTFPLFLSAQDINLDIFLLLEQQLALQNKIKITLSKDDIISDKVRVVIIIDDFGDILLNNNEFLKTIENSEFKLQCKFIYFVDKSMENNQDYQRWIESQNILFQYEIIRLNKNDVKTYLENYLPWDQCISNIDLSLNENHNVIESIIEKIENNLNVREILIKIIKLSSIVDNFEQEAGNAMMILKELKRIFKNEDFSFIRLKNSNFNYLSFNNCNFEGSFLENVNISKCWFIQCNLNNVQWLNMIKFGIQLDLGRQVRSYTFVNDSPLFLATFPYSRIELWHLKAGKRVSTPLYDQNYNNLNVQTALTQKGHILAYAFQTYSKLKITIKSCQSLKIIRQFRPQQITQSIKFSNNNQFMAIVSRKGLHQVWDISQGKLLFGFPEDYIQELRFSSDNKLLAVCNSDNKIQICNIEQQKIQHVINEYKKVEHSTFSPDLRFIAFVLKESNLVVIQDVTTGNVIGKFKNHTSNLITFQFLANSKILACAKHPESIQLITLINQQDEQHDKSLIIELNNQNGYFQQVKEFKLDGNYDSQIIALNFYFNNERNLISGDVKGYIKLYDYLQLAETKKYQDIYDNPTFSPNGKILAFGSCNKENVLIWDIEQGRLLFELPQLKVENDGNSANLITFSSDGQILGYSYKNKIKLWNMNTRQITIEFKHEKQFVYSIKIFSPTKLQLICQDEQTIQIWTFDLEKQILEQKINTGIIDLRQIVQSRCGNLIASCGDREIKIWDFSVSDKLTEILSQVLLVKRIDLSPDGKILASGGETRAKNCQGKIILWDVKTGQSVSTIDLCNLKVTFIKFSPNGQLLACALSNSTIRVWSLLLSQVSQTFLVLKGHNEKVYYIDFSQDGTKLISRSKDAPIQIWQIEKQHYDDYQTEFNQQKLKITLLYGFNTDFNLRAENSILVDSSIVSNSGANLVSLFVQMGGQR